MIKFLDLHKQYSSIKAEIDDAIRSVISEASFIGGHHVNAFEENFAEFHCSKYCVGVANGTDAIEIAIEALNLPVGSEIIVPSNTFIASAEAASRLGFKVVFCNISNESYTLDLEDLANKISPCTSAIIAVHLYGHPCDMDPILEIANRSGIKVIEDCAQAHASEYKNQKVGVIGHIGCFSFYPGKNLGAYGDAGAILTNDEDIALKCRKIANHGRVSKYNHEFPGRNSRLDGLQAAILNVKLKHLDEWTEHRIQIAGEYLNHLKNSLEIVLPKKALWAKHVYHLFVIRYEKRDSLREYLLVNGVETGIHYPVALPNLPAYQNSHHSKIDNFGMNVGSTLLSLPIGEHITNEDVLSITSLIKEF